MRQIFFWGIFLLINSSTYAQGSGYNLLFSETTKANVAIPDDPSFDHPENTFTIEAWIYPTAYPSSVGMIFCKHETVDAREYDMMLTSSGTIRISVYDASSNPYLNYSTAVIPLNEWSHVVHVYSYTSGKQYFYLNGVRESTFNIGNITLASTNVQPMIGAYWLGTDTRSHFTGYIEEVRLWHSERTLTQIRDNMCQKLSGSEASLIAYYPLDEGTGSTTKDASSHNNTGNLINNPVWNLSSAPIGDQSTYLYSSSWTGASLYLSSAQTGFTVSNVSSNPIGFHIYRVDEAPNSVLGISNPNSQEYYGTFPIRNVSSPGYAFVYNYVTTSGTCIDSPVLYKRYHNADPTWEEISANNDPVNHTMTVYSIGERGEFILEYNGIAAVDLGPDIQVCDANSVTLSAGQGFNSYTWQDHSSGSQYIATSSGTYSVTVTSACGTSHDEIEVSFLYSPNISLGNDTSFCLPGTLVLTPGSGYDHYLWQNYSVLDHFEVTSTGTYSVTVSNACGSDSDEISVTALNAPSIDWQNDITVCKGKSIDLYPGNYTTYLWQDNSTGDHYSVTHSGTYSVTVSNACGSDQAQIEVNEVKADIPNLITPNGDGKNETFVIEGVGSSIGSLTVYNEWGNQVFSSDHYANTWKGENLNDGVYYYQYHYQQDVCAYEKGWVQIIR